MVYSVVHFDQKGCLFLFVCLLQTVMYTCSDMNVNSLWPKEKKFYLGLFVCFFLSLLRCMERVQIGGKKQKYKVLVTINAPQSKSKNKTTCLSLKVPTLPTLPCLKAQDGHIAESRSPPDRWVILYIFFSVWDGPPGSSEDNTLSCHWLDYSFIVPLPGGSRRTNI